MDQAFYKANPAMDSRHYAANMGYLMPHCRAKAGGLSELGSKASRASRLSWAVEGSGGAVALDDGVGGGMDGRFYTPPSYRNGPTD